MITTRQHGEDTLVLGAWGCGVFRFPPEICAEIFYSLLIPPNAPFYGLFKGVTFAITDYNIYSLFKEMMEHGKGLGVVGALKTFTEAKEKKQEWRDKKKKGKRDDTQRKRYERKNVLYNAGL